MLNPCHENDMIVNNLFKDAGLIVITMLSWHDIYRHHVDVSEDNNDRRRT